MFLIDLYFFYFIFCTIGLLSAH